MSFWDMCLHTETSEPDGEGKVICFKCGATHQAVLTRALLEESFERIYRQGRHSMSCVFINGTNEWICAPDCPHPRRAA